MPFPHSGQRAFFPFWRRSQTTSWDSLGNAEQPTGRAEPYELMDVGSFRVPSLLTYKG